MKTEIKRKDEEKFLKFKIADNACFDNPLTFDEIIEYISMGILPLEVSEDDGTKVLDEEQFEEIKRVVPFLLKIIDKPRSFIKSLEEKVPVETAKKINHKAISKLSRDSNDWYARTVLNVKPKNVVSDINEETIDLYENRFICSLTDKIAKLVASRRQYYQDQIKNLDDNSAIFAMEKDYHTTSSFPFFNKLNKNAVNFMSDNSFREKLQIELDKTIEVEKKIRLIKRSEFYRVLHKKRKVTDPIQKTNILMFEFNYNQAYKLWKLLNQYHEENKLDTDIEVDEKDLNGYYYLYCFVSILSALHDLGFTETTQNRIAYKDYRLKIDNNSLEFVRAIDCISLKLNDDSIKLGYTNTETSKKADEFLFYPNYIDFETMSRSKVDDYTAQILNQFIDNTKFSTISSRYSLVSINMNRCSEDNTFSDRVYRRFYGIGNNFAPEEDSKDLMHWGNYKSAIVIITPVRLRDNFLKIEKIINYHILKGRDVTTFSQVCPLCGSSHVVASNENTFACHSCKHIVSITYCNDCDKGHKKPITWVKYVDENFLKRDDVVRGDFANTRYFEKMSKIEIIMGEKATTTFELEKEGNVWKLKTICPYCGIKLGTNKN